MEHSSVVTPSLPIQEIDERRPITGARTSLEALNSQLAHDGPSLPTPPVFTSSSVHFNPSPDTLGPANPEHGLKNSTASPITIHDGPTTNSDPRPTSPDASAAGVESSESRKKKKTKVEVEVEEEEEEKFTGHRAELQQDVNFDPAPFKFKPFELAHMLDPKSFDTLSSFGGTAGLLSGLGTSKDHGLSKAGSVQPLVEGSGAFSASIEERRRVYGDNILPIRISKTLLELMWIMLKDKVLIMLSIAAVISLALGFYQDFGVPRTNDEPPVDWVEGVAIMAAIALVVVVGSVNDWQKEKQFKVLNEKKEERGVKVIRDGVETIVDIKEVVVGDIAVLEPGEIVPCDGIFLGGHNVKCDESGATGESDAIKKMTFEECIKVQSGEKGELSHTDCFIISGSKVLEGVGKYVIVAVGTKSFHGRIMMALRGGGEQTPLQRKLNDLAQLIAKLGFVAGLILFTIMMIRFFVQLGSGEPKRTSSENAIVFANILVVAVALVVVAVPEGLPLAVTLALAFATKRMTYENILVRVLGSCETMANASVVCTDKTGTLTQNDMTVVAGAIGVHAKFVRQLDDNQNRTNVDESDQLDRKDGGEFSLDQSHLNEVMSPALQTLINHSIAINSTAFEDSDPETGGKILVGSKTETALLKFIMENGWPRFQKIRADAEPNIVQMLPFSSERKAMGVVVKVEDGKWRLYIKGASEILTRKCTTHVVVHGPGRAPWSPSDDVEAELIDTASLDNITRTTSFYASQMLRTIALCYRDFESWPPVGAAFNDQNEVDYEDLSKDLILIGIVGIEDPLRDGVRDAVAKCHKAGVTIKMCTGDNVQTARSIATQCGIFTPGGIIMEGPVFRTLEKRDMQDIVPRLQVLARSSPEDKKLLVETLKELGEIVGVTGDGTNDGPALKTAHVGFSMGISGTEVAKEASDIILMDDNFASIVKTIIWGRCVNDAVRKFLQFQISTNVTAVVTTVVSAVASSDDDPVLTAVQLLWINMIMDTFAALALATDPATEKLLDRKPEKKTAPLFSVDMYKMILIQSAYQSFISLIFHFLGNQILGLDDTAHNRDIIQTLVFNAFVFAQVFNSINCRRLDRRLNVFEGIHRNYYFISITLLEIAIQVLIVFVGGTVFQVVRIPGREWGISLALGCVSLPLGVLVRVMPSEPFERFFKATRLMRREEVLPTQSPEAEGWGSAITIVQDNLGMFAKLRGGRLQSALSVFKTRSAKLESGKDSAMGVSKMLTMAPTLMAGTVAAGHGYIQGSLSDLARKDASAALWEGKLQLHPDTLKDSVVFQRYGGKSRVV